MLILQAFQHGWADGLAHRPPAPPRCPGLASGVYMLAYAEAAQVHPVGQGELSDLYREPVQAELPL